MKKVFCALRSHLRTAVQIIFTAVTNGYVYGFATGKIFRGNFKNICVPGLSCYSCPGALGSCPIGSLQAVLSSAHYRFAFYVVGFLLLFGSVLGRFVCGWLCPFGLVQDLLYKIPLPKRCKRQKLPGDKILKYLKYFILAGFVIILPMFAVGISGNGDPWFCKYICPSGTLLGGVPLLLANPSLRAAAGFLFQWKFAILLILLLLSVVVCRPFCRYLCPLGAVYGFFNPIALYRYTVNSAKCTSCGLCTHSCALGIAAYRNPNSFDCIRCGACLEACPQKAITVAGKKAKIDNTVL